MKESSIARVASRLRFGLLASMFLLVILYVVARSGLAIGHTQVAYRGGTLSQMPAIVADVALAVVIFALFRLTQMLALIASGDLFSTRVISRFRGFAFWLMIAALIGLLAPLAVNFAATDPSGPRRVEIPINVRDVVTLGITFVLFLIARLLERARELEQEVSEFV